MNALALRAALAVAAVYGYFLIFAQFAFVELLRAAGIGADLEKVVLGAMAVAGIASGFLTAWIGVSPVRVRMALGVGMLAACLASLASGTAGFIAVAIMTGAALGVATVGLSAMLPAWCGLAWVGFGTGLGYAVCNLPQVFLQNPAAQAWIAAGLALLGVIALPRKMEWKHTVETKVFPLWGAVALFTALVWMDSAAFFIIQHAGDLKSDTWGEAFLWRNAVVHLAIACGSGLWLSRGGAKILPVTSWIILAVAALMVNDESTRSITGWFYPVGVSIYSTALVAWPGWFSGANDVKHAAWRAAWLFAIAGWFGSANGIGMAQTLERVPWVFIATAGVLVVTVMILTNQGHWRMVFAMVVVMIAGWMGGKGNHKSSVASAAERGRQVYISEGCIHCHSQYVRPESPDEQIWGPSRKIEEVLKGQPVLIGNRRQGPDLTNVGARRSEAWLKQHFIGPRLLVPDSTMPSYAHLFKDGRGEDLVRYLKLSGVSATADVMARGAAWKPAGAVDGENGEVLFATHCAACHGAGGYGNGPLAGLFMRPPANLVKGPFIWTTAGPDQPLRTARVIKFGIIATDMPGHEVLTDAQVSALVAEVLRLRSDMP